MNHQHARHCNWPLLDLGIEIFEIDSLTFWNQDFLDWHWNWHRTLDIGHWTLDSPACLTVTGVVCSLLPAKFVAWHLWFEIFGWNIVKYFNIIKYLGGCKNNEWNSIILWTFWKGNLATISWIFLPVMSPITSTNGAHHQTWPFPNRRCVKTLKFVLPNIWFNEKVQTTLLLLWCDGNAGILWGQECAILVPRDCRPGEYLVRNLRA